jgi:tRNA (cytidine/uridine-2'-O-)-methyltransferase
LPTGNFRLTKHSLVAHDEHSMRIALYQPEIAGNLGTILRTCACLDVAVDIIEPCGFPFSDRSLKRAGMDYFEHVRYSRHADWDAFRATVDSLEARIILLSSKADAPHHGFAYRKNDILLFGSEGSGVPLTVQEQCDGRITIPMKPGMRSLNLAVSAGMALGEALRQTGQFPE